MWNILIIDDSDGTYTFCQEFLTDQFNFHYSRNGQNLDNQLKKNKIDLILLDKNFQELPDEELVGPLKDKHNEGLHILNLIKKTDDSIPVIMITSYGDYTSAEQAINLGAYDYIDSDMLSRGESLLKNRVINALQHTSEDYSELVNKFRDLGMIGSSTIAINIYKAIESIVNNDDPVLLLGPTGAGKDLAACIIHKLSTRKEHSFIDWKVSERSESAIESELFGAEKKAFTGVDSSIGVFEKASGGTILLNEIGEIPPNIQTKLLGVLEGNTIYKSGGSNPIITDFRLICATNKDIDNEVEKGSFRRDLYYRINNNVIYLPPLSERTDDISEMIKLILDDYSKETNKERPEISDKAIEILKKRQWTGNFRELRKTIKRLAEISEGVITLGTIINFDKQKDTSQNKGIDPTETYTFKDKTFKEVERDYFEFYYKKFNGDIDKMANATGRARATLYDRKKQYGLK